MKLIPFEEVMYWIGISESTGDDLDVLKNHIKSLPTIDPIATIDEMIEELYEKKNCETCRQHASKLCVEHQEVESFLEKLESLLCNYK